MVRFQSSSTDDWAAHGGPQLDRGKSTQWIDTDARPGALLEVRIDDVADEYDFTATPLRVVSAPPASRRRSTRSLPMVTSLPTVGSYGR